jgi:eukaryotic-like serine/threonine-protein kinase
MRSGSRPDSVQSDSSEALIAGRYELLRPLAKGGMGEVFLARDLATGDSVALKRVRDGQLRRPKVLAHFRAEYHALSRLRHPRIIKVHEFGVFDGVPYYTMELLDGKDLRDLGPVPYREACGYLRDIASSLALLHA